MVRPWQRTGGLRRNSLSEGELNGLATAFKIMASQRRIAIFVSNMHAGGTQRSMLNLASGIADRGFAVDLVLARAEGPFLNEIPNLVRVVDLNARRVATSLPAVIRYLRQELPVAMLSALDYVNIVALWAKHLTGGSQRIIVSERSTLSYAARDSKSLRGRLMPLLTSRYYPWADGIVAVSQGVADDLSRETKVPRNRIQVIYNPVVTPEIQRKARSPLDHEWFKQGQPPVVMAAGRLAAEKDFPTLIRAFALVRRSRPCRLLILGDGDERESLEALVSRLGLQADVSLPGFVKNPYAFMARAALFVLTSKWEGLPGVLIEALYCGAPLVSTDCPSGPREILADGEFGQLVPVGDGARLAQAINTALDEGRTSVPSNSWHPYELDTVVDQYINTLMGV